MGYLLVGVIVSLFAALLWLFISALNGFWDDNPKKGFLCLGACGLLVTLGLGTGVQLSINQANSGPCLRTETGTHKGRQYTYCAERGTWVDEGNEVSER